MCACQHTTLPRTTQSGPTNHTVPNTLLFPVYSFCYFNNGSERFPYSCGSKKQCRRCQGCPRRFLPTCRGCKLQEPSLFLFFLLLFFFFYFVLTDSFKFVGRIIFLVYSLVFPPAPPMLWSDDFVYLDPSSSDLTFILSSSFLSVTGPTGGRKQCFLPRHQQRKC